MAVAIEDAGFEIRDQLAWVYGSGFPKSHNLGDGWGTALKPAWEPICLCRKPLEGTNIANMAKWALAASTSTLAALKLTRPRSSNSPARAICAAHEGYERPGRSMFRTNPPCAAVPLTSKAAGPPISAMTEAMKWWRGFRTATARRFVQTMWIQPCMAAALKRARLAALGLRFRRPFLLLRQGHDRRTRRGQ
jgi:hypothetical protein